MKRKIIIVAWEVSRTGGIEEVSRQVKMILEECPNIAVRTYLFPKGRIKSIWACIHLILLSWTRVSLMFMHPFIFEQFKYYRRILPKRFNAILWAYGIDVWGESGRRNASFLFFAKKIIAVSTFTKDRILENFPHAVIDVVNLSVDNKLAEYNIINSHSFEIITVARLSSQEKYKGHDLVLHALKILKDRHIKPKYNIVGQGNDFERLNQLTQDLGLEEQVVFHGYVPDEEIGKIYGRSSVFVMPSCIIRRGKEIWGGEGFGLVYLEAGLHGLPVIACNKGGQTDCILDGKTGFLVNPYAKEVAEKIQYLYDHPDFSRKMGQAGRKHVKENFSFNIFRKNVITVLENTFIDSN